MPTDNKTEDQVTEAGAVELEETQLDDASGGLLPAIQTTELKINTSLTASPDPVLDASFQKVRGD